MEIPFIIHPIDYFTDWLLDNFVRTFYSDETKRFLFINEKRGDNSEDEFMFEGPDVDLCVVKDHRDSATEC